MRIKLLYAPSSYASHHCSEGEVLPPLGLGVIAAALRKQGHYTELDDLNIRTKDLFMNSNSLHYKVASAITLGKFEKAIRQYISGTHYNKKAEMAIEGIIGRRRWNNYDLVGISILDATQFLWSLAIAKYLQLRNTPVVFGGAYMNALGYKYFERTKFIEYMILGPGENSLSEFIRFLEGKIGPKDVPGLYYRLKDNLYKNDLGSYDIEDSVMPDFSGLPLDLYKVPHASGAREMIVPYQISTGCICRCNFCNSPGRGAFQHKSVEKVIYELKHLTQQCSTTLIHFVDNNLFFSYGYIETLCEQIIQNRLLVRWGGNAGIADSRQNHLDSNILKKMKKAGCSWLSIGVETGSDRLRWRMGKRHTSVEFSEVLQASHAAGIANTCNFIAGYPYENKKDIRLTVRFLKDNARYISVSRYSRFSISFNSPIYLKPWLFGVRIIGEYTVAYKPFFEFDEINGFDWKGKKKAIEHSYRIIGRAAYRFIIRRQFKINPLIPFWVYNLIKNVRSSNNRASQYLYYLFSFFPNKYPSGYRFPYLLKYGILERLKE